MELLRLESSKDQLVGLSRHLRWSITIQKMKLILNGSVVIETCAGPTSFIEVLTLKKRKSLIFLGLRQRDPATTFEIWSTHQPVSSDTHDNFHDYKVEWTPEAITYSIDGQQVHQQTRNGTFEKAGTGDGVNFDHYHYPDTPLLVTLGIWNSNEVVKKYSFLLVNFLYS